MRIFKEKKNELLEVGKEFNSEVLKSVKLLDECINECLDGKCDLTKVSEVILTEHIGDRLKDKYIEILYKEKRALPFLVEDRYRIVKYLDVIADTAEDIAYILKIYSFTIYSDIINELKMLSGTMVETVQTLIEMVNLMETGFKKAYEKSFAVENHKRLGRELKYKILEKLYQKDDKSLKVYLTSKLCIKMQDIILKAEEISDFLRSLIIKYPSK
ncbi:MAG: DUF47 family protein [Promethearchaeota archaeon]